jgi:multiple sugar transport system substrate-binding protein
MSKVVRSALTTLAVSAVVMTAACGGNGDGGDNDDESNGAAQGPVTLSYAIWDANQAPIMEELAEAFTAQNANVSVDVQVTPWDEYWTKLRASVSGGAAADVFWMNGPNFQLYAGNDVIAPLTENIDADGVDVSVYPQGMLDLYTLDGELYTLPRDFDTIAVWYNKEIFDEAGVPYPEDGWTWDDFRETAAELTDPDAGIWGASAHMSGHEYFYNTIHQAGGYVISEDAATSGYDDPASIEGLRFWTDLIEQGYSPDQQTMIDTLPDQLFASGRIAMYWGGSWRVTQFTENEYTREVADVAPLPMGVQRASVVHGVANVISAETEHPDEAWEFMKFLGSREAAEILGRSGPIPAYEGTQDAWIAANPHFDLGVFVDAVEYGVPYPVSANTAAWNEEEDTHLAPAWSGSSDVETAASDLAAAMNDLLAQE